MTFTISREFVETARALDWTTGELVAEAIVDMRRSSWLIGGLVPGIERQPRQKLEPSPEQLFALLQRWRDEAVRAGRTVSRIALPFEAGRRCNRIIWGADQSPKSTCGTGGAQWARKGKLAS